jgi:hypothetical protein
MIAEDPGVWLANEPFAVLPAHPAYQLKRKYLSTPKHSHFFDLSAEEEEKFGIYTDLLLRAGLPQLGTCRHSKFPLVADRVCLKVLNAPWMIAWFEASTDCHILPILRHPGAQAMSVIRQKWQFPLEAYAERIGTSGLSLTLQQENAVQAALRAGDIWQMAILDYAVTSKMMREKYREDLFYYEQIVAEPAPFVDEVLIKRFGLSDRDRILSRIRQPSGSKRMSLEATNAAISEGKVNVMINSWRKQVTPEMMDTAQEVLDLFEIDQYSFTRPDFTS